MVCEHGYKADADRCTKITCATGSFLNDDNECEKAPREAAVAKRDGPERKRAPETRQVSASEAKPIAGRSQTKNWCGAGI